jgi:hypothetical protein
LPGSPRGTVGVAGMDQTQGPILVDPLAGQCQAG